MGGIRDFVKAWKPKLPEPVRLSGFPVIVTNLIEHVNHDLKVFGVASIVLFSLALFLIFRKVRFVIGPLLTCALPVVIVVGVMGYAGITMTVITSNMPLLLFVLMLPYTIYAIERFRERRAAASMKNPSRALPVASVASSCRASSPASRRWPGSLP